VARQHGAALQSVDAFAEVLDGTGASGRRTTKRQGAAGAAADDKTLSPAEEESINASLRREWGLL
jgi:hypothetical protein